MSYPIAVREFGDQPINLIELEGGRFWVTAEELGRALGYAQGNEGKGVSKLFERHADELARYRRFVKMTNGDTTHRVTVFEERAIYHMALLAKTERAKQFRMWVAETLDDLRTHGKLIISRDEWERTQQLLERLLIAYETQAKSAADMASCAGRILGLRSHSKPKHDPRQQLLPGFVVTDVLPGGKPDPEQLPDGEGTPGAIGEDATAEQAKNRDLVPQAPNISTSEQYGQG